ncbi:AraC family transcriptional regulator [Variovorax saccharolyticus]|uniref:AraC family transcriptional regulator n=1 Tax=Variovorax saccharolyticus TaxID=3053516 RepID=UPI002575B20F|nr:AraC family transcriptional regulator [Variovorax sp. J22R187]MDM0018346.1 AraC family transcriptional regulator [Variovorax sp. J22R187]
MSSVDRLSSLLERFHVRAHLFHAGPLCGTTRFAAREGRGFLHVLRRGEMVVTHASGAGVPRRIVVKEPSLLFYPRPLAHNFRNAPVEGSDFVCATLDFDGGDAHPLARALPPLICIALREVDGLEQAIALLFAETTQLQCGHRLLADRLFEVVLIQLLRWLLDHPQQGDAPVGLLAGLGDPRLARALTAVHDRPGEAWTLERMAREAGMSRSSFAYRFKSVVGDTPADYLATWRLTIAQAELRNGASVKTIAHLLGYANASALSRLFTQRLGLSPRDWLAARA